MLGGSETIGPPQDDAFETVSKKRRVYRRIGPRRLDKLELSMIHRGSRRVRGAPAPSRHGRPAAREQLAGWGQRLVLE